MVMHDHCYQCYEVCANELAPLFPLGLLHEVSKVYEFTSVDVLAAESIIRLFLVDFLGVVLLFVVMLHLFIIISFQVSFDPCANL